MAKFAIVATFEIAQGQMDAFLPLLIAHRDRCLKDASIRVNLLMDLTMLMTHKGRERTENEFRRLFEHTGFGLASVRRTRTGHGIFEGVPA